MLVVYVLFFGDGVSWGWCYIENNFDLFYFWNILSYDLVKEVIYVRKFGFRVGILVGLIDGFD